MGRFQLGQMSGEVAIGQACNPRQEGKVRVAAYSFAVTVSPIGYPCSTHSRLIAYHYRSAKINIHL
jgi:hypothetical protein